MHAKIISALGWRTVISRFGAAFDTPVRDAYGYIARSVVTYVRRTLEDSPDQVIRSEPLRWECPFDQSIRMCGVEPG